MKDYKGIIKISCKRKKCFFKKDSIDYDCISCKYRSATIDDLTGKNLFTFDKIVTKKQTNKEK